MNSLNIAIDSNLQIDENQVQSILKNYFPVQLNLIQLDSNNIDHQLKDKQIDIALIPYSQDNIIDNEDMSYLYTSLPTSDFLDSIVPLAGQEVVLKCLRNRDDLVELFSPYFGKVWFVGAGAGTKDLITVKGKKRLEKADVVISDFLLDQKMLNAFTNKNAIILPLTKYGVRIHKNQVSQEHINETILKFSFLKKRVVRLKGGDSFVFGRGGEECEYILPFKINFEVVPGISAMLSALSFAGIPLTHRNYNAGFMMITGYRQLTHEPEVSNKDIADRINFGLKHNLVVGLFMSLSNWKNFVDHINNKETPLALIESGAYENQRVVLTNVKESLDVISKSNLKSPTLMVLGENVRVREKIKWFEKLPLAGTPILCFASEKLSLELDDMLTDLGAYIKCYQLYNLVPDTLEKIAPYIKSLSTYDYLIVTSRNAFDIFFESMKSLQVDIRSIPKVIVTGEKTEDEFKKFGIIPDIVPNTFSSDGIIEELSKLEIEGKRFLLPKSSLSQGNLSTFIKEQKGELDEFILYQNKPVNLTEQEINDINKQNPRYIIFTSSSSVDYFFEKFSLDKDKFTAISIGTKTTLSLKNHGITNILEPKNFTTEGIQELLVQQVTQ